MAVIPEQECRVVIVGGGFAGLYAALELGGAPAEVTVVDRSNHHLFQPLLYQVATAALAPSDITVPIRWRLRKQRNTTVLLGEVTRVDPEARRIRLADGAAIEYDWLILAPGSRHSYFAHPEWERHAPGLKSLEDGLDMRRRFLIAFERAERAASAAEREALLTFVVVGGGPTGVELAGVMVEIARKALRADFRRIDTTTARVMLVEAGPRLLPAFPEDLAARARTDLEEIGVDVRVGRMVEHVAADHVIVSGERIDACTVFWAAGNEASPLGRMLGAPVDRAGRVRVEPDLSVPGHPEVFVAGDLAAVPRGDGLVPAMAPAAMQMGRHVARTILRELRHQERRPFRYLDKGELATVGRSRAIAKLGRVHFAGPLAWWLWLGVHIMYLAGFRNRLSVLLQWAWAYLTYQRGARLITGVAESRVLQGESKL